MLATDGHQKELCPCGFHHETEPYMTMGLVRSTSQVVSENDCVHQGTPIKLLNPNGYV